MPIYEYECKKCGYVTSFMEKTQRGQGATTTIRYGKSNWTISEGKSPEGLRPWKAVIKWAAAQSANKNCAKKTQFYMFAIQQRLSTFFKRKCEKCGSRRLSKVFSIFTPNCVKSNADTMNELSKMGNINFVPQSPGMGGHHGPPPGGCPYANSTDSQSDD